jgi:hypothetical protein
MNRLEIPQKGIVKTYPSCMEELNAEQAIVSAGLLYNVYTKAIDPEMFLKLIGDYFLDRKNNPVKLESGEGAWDYWANEFRISETVEFFFDVKKTATEVDGVFDKEYVFEPKCVKQLVPEYRKTYGCMDLMTDISWDEFKNAMVAMQEFVAGGERESLVELAASLYRPHKKMIWLRRLLPGWKGEKRIAYTDYSRECMIDFFRKASDGFLFYVFVFFSGCLYHLKNEEIFVDGEPIRFRPIFVGEGKSSDDDNVGLTGVLFSLAESGVFGNAEETGKARFFDVLLRLYQTHLQAKKIKRKK